MRFKPPTILRRHRVRSLLTAGAILAAVSGTVLMQSTPALADPQVTLVGVGSNTTQAVWDAFTNGTIAGTADGTSVPATSAPLSPGLVGSYDAVNPVNGNINENITPVDGTAVANGTVPNPGGATLLNPGTCSFARPNGSGQGVAALRLALNASSTNASKAIAPYPGLGCVDFARSSSGVDVSDDNPTVDLQWVPFAIDGVTGAIGPSSCTPSTNCPTFAADLGNGNTETVTTVPTALGTGPNSFTIADIHALYTCNPVTIGSVTYWPAGSPGTEPSTDQTIDLYVPQPGSGTRSFWEGTGVANFPDSAVDTTCVWDHLINGPLASANDGGITVPVEENHGAAVDTDPDGYTPLSISQYISQQNSSHSPEMFGATLQDINTGTAAAPVLVSPFVTAGSPESGLNTSFPILRYVYDVVQLSRLTNSSDPIDALFNGVGSTVCHQHALIQQFGFALMSSTVFDDLTCGEISTTLEGAP
jgi:hypothetical protein